MNNGSFKMWKVNETSVKSKHIIPIVFFVFAFMILSVTLSFASTIIYTYDESNRLIYEDRTEGTIEYQYDEAGNRSGRTFYAPTAITPSAGNGGSISPNTAQTVHYNTVISFTVTPNPGYHIVSVTGCNGTLAGSTYTTGVITSDCTVSASFGINAIKRISGATITYYTTFSDAYNAVSAQDTIQGQTLIFNEAVTFNLNVPVIFKGGYNSAFTSQTGYTTIVGTLTITRGTLTVEKLILQ